MANNITTYKVFLVVLMHTYEWTQCTMYDYDYMSILCYAIMQCSGIEVNTDVPHNMLMDACMYVQDAR